MEIVWSNIAILDNLTNIDYLLNEWSLSVVKNYEACLIDVLELIEKNPQLGSFDDDLKANKILIIPQLYLIYEVTNNKIKILRIWNNYQKPYW